MKNIIIDKYCNQEIQKCSIETDLGQFIYKTVAAPQKLTFEHFSQSHDISITIHPIVANYKGFFHSHNYFEFIYVYQGTAIQYFPGHEVTIQQGQFALLNMNTEHSISITSEDSILFSIQISKELLNKSFLSLIAQNDLLNSFFIESMFHPSGNEQHIIFESNKNSRAEYFIQELLVEYIQQLPCYLTSIYSLLSLIFTELLRSHIYHMEQNSESDIAFSTILKYINDNIADITLSAVSEHFHYNTSYMSRLFKKNTNRTFSDVINEIRITNASSYLKSTSLNIDTVSDLVGYYDRSYFNKVFRKRFKMSPGEYRESFKEIK